MENLCSGFSVRNSLAFLLDYFPQKRISVETPTPTVAPLGRNPEWISQKRLTYNLPYSRSPLEPFPLTAASLKSAPPPAPYIYKR